MPTDSNLSKLTIDNADELQAVASFTAVLYGQCATEWSTSRGVGKWVWAIERGEELQVLPAVPDAKAAVAGHPFEQELLALIGAASAYVAEVAGNYVGAGGRFSGRPFSRPEGRRPTTPVA